MVKLTEKDICEITKRVAKRMVNEARFEITRGSDTDDLPGTLHNSVGRFDIVTGSKKGFLMVVDRETGEPLMDSAGNTEFRDVSGKFIGKESLFQVNVPTYDDEGNESGMTKRNIPVKNPEAKGRAFGDIHPDFKDEKDWRDEKPTFDSDLRAKELGNPEHHNIEAYAGDPEENRKRLDDIVRGRRLERLKRDSMDI